MTNKTLKRTVIDLFIQRKPKILLQHSWRNIGQKKKQALVFSVEQILFIEWQKQIHEKVTCNFNKAFVPDVEILS